MINIKNHSLIILQKYEKRSSVDDYIDSLNYLNMKTSNLHQDFWII